MRRCERHRRSAPSRSLLAMSRAAKSSQQPAAPAVRLFVIPSMLDSAIIMAIVTLMVMMALSAGSRRGVELMPWPDGLEYAASAVNLANGRGAVLHFGGYTYPSRYTAGYPLILEVIYRLFGGHVPLLTVASSFLGSISVGILCVLARGLFGRAAGAIAPVLLALSP